MPIGLMLADRGIWSGATPQTNQEGCGVRSDLTPDWVGPGAGLVPIIMIDIDDEHRDKNRNAFNFLVSGFHINSDLDSVTITLGSY